MPGLGPRPRQGERYPPPLLPAPAGPCLANTAGNGQHLQENSMKTVFQKALPL